MRKKTAILRHRLDWPTTVRLRFRRVREAAGVTQAEMAARAGRTAAQSVSQFEAGATETVPWPMLEAYLGLARVVGVDPCWVMGLIDDAELDARTRAVGAFGPQAGPALWPAIRQAAVAGIISGAAPPGSPPVEVALGAGRSSGLPPVRLVEPGFEVIDPEQLPPEWRGAYVPIIGRVAAGTQFVFDTARAESLPAGIADSYVRCGGAPNRAFAVEVRGDSMSPRFDHGDIVVADPDTRVASGVCVAVETQRGGSRVPRLKVLRLRGRQCELVSLNPKYPPIRVASSNVEAFAVWRHLPWKRETTAR